MYVVLVSALFFVIIYICVCNGLIFSAALCVFLQCGFVMSCFFIIFAGMYDFRGKKAAYFTLGCKLNFSESSTIGQQLKAAGVETVRKGEAADICIVNTCSVTEVADAKCRQAISRMVRHHKGALVVVTGCYAQLKPETVASLKGVDLVLGAEQKGQMLERIAERLEMTEESRRAVAHEYVTSRVADIRTFVPSCSCGDRTRYFLKVQDGCDYYCTYCTIPFARGRSRNGSIESLVGQARDVALRGGREIVITGVNTGDFGKSTGESFIDLVKALDGVEGIERYRISSIEPNLLTDEVIDYCAGSRAFMPHFHIPLQSGSDEVLRLMHRRYDTELFARKVESVRRAMPDAFIGVDVIVGMRGETDALFRESKSFMESLDVSQYHVFSYSERAGTKALQIPHSVTPEEKHNRSRQILEVSDSKRRAFYRRFVHGERPVLLEHSRTAGVMHGFTDNYIKVELDVAGLPQSPDNTVVRVRLGEWNAGGDALKAVICGTDGSTAEV